MASLPSYINPELNLEPPAPMDHMDSDDEDRYELWTVRVPVSMKVEELNGVTIDLNALRNGRMELSDGKYVLSQGESNENETFRVLVPESGKNSDSGSDSNSDSDSSSFSDSDDEDEAKKKKKSENKNNNKFLLYPSRKGFSRHLNIHKNLLERKTEAELAPSKGPDPVGCKLKHSYSHIPQRKGLKRRWMPFGNTQKAIEIDPKLITLKAEKLKPTVTDDNDNECMEEETPVKQEKPKSPCKKRRRSNSNAQSEMPTAVLQEASPKKKKRSWSNSNDSANKSNESTPTTKQKKVKSEKKSEKKAKKSKKSKKKVKREEEDAISV